MKRLIASRKLKRTCYSCDCGFKKGDVYYIKRFVYTDFECHEGLDIIAYEYLVCPKCQYKQEHHKERLEQFKSKCHHPITDEKWSYIPGEVVMQPDHDECLICGEWV
jgi:hypothetical protein